MDLGKDSYLEVQDGDNAAAPSLARFEGSDVSPSIVVSTSGAVRLYLHTEKQFNGKGFKCSYIEGECTELSTALLYSTKHYMRVGVCCYCIH